VSEEDGEIVVTEFGPIDRRSRNLFGYLVLFVMFAIATGASWSILTDPNIWERTGGGFVLTVVVVLYACCIGMPAIMFFGQKQPPRPTEHRTSRPRSTGRRPRIERKTTESGGGFTEVVTYPEESPQTLETVVEGEPKTDKKQKTPDISYRGEYPKRKMEGYDQ